MIVSLLCIIFFLIFSNFLLAEVDIELLKQNYPKCENSDYRHECFDDVKQQNFRYMGYFRNNSLWEGQHFQNDILTFEFVNGEQITKSFCEEKEDGWFVCRDGSRNKPIDGGYYDSEGNAQGQFIAEFSSGNKFVGEFKDNLKHGKGTFTWADGTKYVGQYKDDLNSGQGTYTFANGDKYVGEYKEGLRSGQGTYTYADGNKYVGEWKNGVKSGQGTFTWASGDKYIGGYKDGKFNGQGTYIFTDGRKDVGEWENDKLNGYAIQYNADGTIRREGIFKDDDFLYAETRDNKTSATQLSFLPSCPSDQKASYDMCFGTYDWTSGDNKGDRYKGEWKKDLQHGQGKYTYANGDEYFGEFKDGKKHGQGTFTYETGDKYIGEYKKGIMFGQGMYIWSNGDRYQGTWKAGKKHGPGIYLFLSNNEFKGDIYVGEYMDDIRHGQGTYIFKDGSKYTGNWLDNNPDGQGIYIYTDGSKDLGEFKNGLLNGYAIKYKADGSIKQEGIFKDDEFLHAKTSENDEFPSQMSSLPPCPSDPNATFDNCFGTWQWDDGSKYEGEWKKDKKHGQGTFTFANNDKYVGKYKDDLSHGQGTYTFADGRKDVGEWENDNLNGYAIQYNADGTIRREGIFKDDEFLYAETREKKELSKLDKSKSTCEELGFTPGTEKYGDCVMKFMGKD